jgi:hypothetical protein
MIIDPIQLLVKTAANYIAFKMVKNGVDSILNDDSNEMFNCKAAKCMFCKNVWTDSPEECPHCGCIYFKKLYKEYDFRKEEDGFSIDSNLTMRN